MLDLRAEVALPLVDDQQEVVEVEARYGVERGLEFERVVLVEARGVKQPAALGGVEHVEVAQLLERPGPLAEAPRRVLILEERPVLAVAAGGEAVVDARSLLVAVHAQRERLAHARVVERGLVEVFEGHVRLPAGGGRGDLNDHVGVGLDGPLVLRDVLQPDPVGLARLPGGPLGLALVDEVETVDRLEVGQLHPGAGVLFEVLRVGAAAPLRAGGCGVQRERAGSDLVLGEVQQARLLDELRRHDDMERVHHVVEQVGGRLGQVEAHRVAGVVELDVLDGRVGRGLHALGIAQRVVGDLHVLGGHVAPVDGRLVLPLDAGAQLEDDRRRVGDLPALGEVALVEVVVGVGEVVHGEDDELAVEHRREGGHQAGVGAEHVPVGRRGVREPPCPAVLRPVGLAGEVLEFAPVEAEAPFLFGGEGAGFVFGGELARQQADGLLFRGFLRGLRLLGGGLLGLRVCLGDFLLLGLLGLGDGLVVVVIAAADERESGGADAGAGGGAEHGAAAHGAASHAGPVGAL